MLFNINADVTSKALVLYNQERALIPYRGTTYVEPDSEFLRSFRPNVHNFYSEKYEQISENFKKQISENPELKNNREFILTYACIDNGRLVRDYASLNLKTDPEIIGTILKNCGSFFIPWELQTDLGILYLGLQLERERKTIVSDILSSKLKNKVSAATLFATVILLNDGFKSLKQDPTHKTCRFWTIVLRLPEDAQQIIINRLFNISTNFILSNGRDIILKSIIKE